VFTLCHVSEHSTSDVSQALGLSEATVRVHLFRAVRKLRKLLAGEPGDMSAGTPSSRMPARRSGPRQLSARSFV
jgi:hypothetical protein